MTGAFPTVATDDISEPNNLVFGGRLNNNETASFWVAVTAPDEIDAVVDDRVTFVLRQSAVAVPEPSSLMLAALGLLSLLGFSRQRRRAA